jgi:hypothetical protein
MPADLDVHLQRGDSLARSGHLEVHIAVVVFGAGNVGEDGVIVALLHQAHRHAGHRALQRMPACISARLAPHTEAIDDDPFDSRMSRPRAAIVRRLVGARQHRLIARSANAPWPISRRPYAGHASGFAHAERREVVVQHEAPLLALVALQPLAVVHGAQRRRHQRLRLAARKQRRSVRARQHAGLDRDGPNLVERAPVGPDALLRHLLAEDPLAQQFVIVRQLLLGRGSSAGSSF